jgi:hypothetical protein
MLDIRRLFQKSNQSVGGSIIQEYSPTAKPLELGSSNAPAEWRVLREKHYRKWLGDAENILVWHEVLPTVPHVDIHVFPPSKALGRDYYTLITSGMSDERMMLPKGVDKQHARAEIIFYVANDETKSHQNAKPWYAQAISFYAHFPFDYKTWLAASHTLPNGNPPSRIVENSSLTTAFFLPAIFEGEEFSETLRLGSDRVNFLWLTFLSDKETELKLKYGYDKLVERCDKYNLPQVFNPFRPSIV